MDNFSISPYVVAESNQHVTTKSDVKVKCPKCGLIKQVRLCSHLQTIRKNRGVYLCHKCSINSEQCSLNAKKLWSDPKKAETMRKHLQSKEMKLAISANNKKYFSDQRWIEQWKKSINKGLISDRSKSMWQDLEFRKRISRSFSLRCKKQWRDPEYRSKLMAHLSSPARKTQMLEVRRKMAVNKSSKQQDILYGILDDLNVQYEKEANFGYYLFDCKIPPQGNLKETLLIEVNGDYWHSLPKSERNDKSKSTYIRKYFIDHIIKYVWEHEFIAKDRVQNLIKYWLGIDRCEHKKFEFKDVVEKLIDSKTAEIFIGKYHYASRLGRSGINLGYFLGETLVAVIIYAYAVRQEVAIKQGYAYKQVRELSRLAIHPTYQVRNLASHLISRSMNYIRMNHSDVKLLVTFADSSFNHAGTIYKASNWLLDGVVEPDYWYVDHDGYVCHKKTLWNKASEMKMTEIEYSIKYGYNKIWGKGKTRYIYKLC